LLLLLLLLVLVLLVLVLVVVVLLLLLLVLLLGSEGKSFEVCNLLLLFLCSVVGIFRSGNALRRR
jgi:hypothetical protein